MRHHSGLGKTRLRGGLTCQTRQEKLIGAPTFRFVNIGEHSKCKLPFIERMTANDTQVLQGNPGRRVECDQDVATHFFNRLRKKETRKLCCKLNVRQSGILRDIQKNSAYVNTI